MSICCHLSLPFMQRTSFSHPCILNDYFCLGDVMPSLCWTFFISHHGRVKQGFLNILFPVTHMLSF